MHKIVESKTIYNLTYFFKDGWESIKEALDAKTYYAKAFADSQVFIFIVQFITFIIAFIGTFIFGILACVFAIKSLTKKVEFKSDFFRLLLSVELLFVTTMFFTSYSIIIVSDDSVSTGNLSSGTSLLVSGIIIGVFEEMLTNISSTFTSKKNLNQKLSTIFCYTGLFFFALSWLTGFNNALSFVSLQEKTRIKLSNGVILLTNGSIFDSISSDSSSMDEAFKIAEKNFILSLTAFIFILCSFVLFFISFGAKNNKKDLISTTIIYGSGYVFAIIAIILTLRIKYIDSTTSITTSLGTSSILFIIFGLITISLFIAAIIFNKDDSTDKEINY